MDRVGQVGQTLARCCRWRTEVWVVKEEDEVHTAGGCGHIAVDCDIELSCRNECSGHNLVE